MRPARTLLVACAAGLTLLTGCSSGSSGGLSTPLSSTSPTPSPSSAHQVKTQKALKRTVRAYLRAFLGGNETAAFSLLSHHCKLTYGRQQFRDLVTSAASTYGAMSPSSITVHSLSGDSATVGYKLPVPKLDAHSQDWTYESGWRYDAC